MQAVEVSTTDPSAKLGFSDFRGGKFTVSLIGPEIQIARSVYAHKEMGINDVAALLKLFNKMKNNWKGWKGALSWESLEGEFGITATSNSLGHVTLHLMFQEAGSESPWRAEIDLTLEPMQVEKAHRDLEKLFS